MPSAAAFWAESTMGEPGARTIWLGMQEIAVFVSGARYARQFNDGCAMGWRSRVASVSLPARKRKMKVQEDGERWQAARWGGQLAKV